MHEQSMLVTGMMHVNTTSRRCNTKCLQTPTVILSTAAGFALVMEVSQTTKPRVVKPRVHAAFQVICDLICTQVMPT